MRASPGALEAQRELRWIADAYEQAQETRVQTGERIRASLQGRVAGAAETAVLTEADEVLERIRRGESDGPSPFLARIYRLHASAEATARSAMAAALERHPAWPWLGDVRGVGPVLGCRLLARLDPVRAATPSSFWAYCGLGTVPGREYRCETCGRTVTQPDGFEVSGAHQRLGRPGRCPGRLRPRRGPEAGVRAAQPRYGPREHPSYSTDGKHICYLIVVSFLRCRSPYARVYRTARSELEDSRTGWAPGRIHLTAIRKTSKLFLTHLWVVWRKELGLPVARPHPAADGCHSDPWSMTGPAIPML